jgi:P27 family predicted phage terminase small subunit
MARPRQPLALAKLKGTRTSRLNVHEPQFKGTPKCPSWLPKEAKAEWKRAYALLAPFNILRSTDQAMFAAYCVSWSNWKQAEMIVQKEGQTCREPVVTRSGNPTGDYKIRTHPAVAIARQEKQMMQRFASLFGLDPSSRARISTGELGDLFPQPVGDDDDADLFVN